MLRIIYTIVTSVAQHPCPFAMLYYMGHDPLWAMITDIHILLHYIKHVTKDRVGPKGTRELIKSG